MDAREEKERTRPELKAWTPLLYLYGEGHVTPRTAPGLEEREEEEGGVGFKKKVLLNVESAGPAPDSV